MCSHSRIWEEADVTDVYLFTVCCLTRRGKQLPPYSEPQKVYFVCSFSTCRITGYLLCVWD